MAQSPWSGATAINDVDEVVGTYGGIGAFVWNSDDGITDFNLRITSDSGWTIDEAYDINNSGQVIGLALKDIGTTYPAARSVLLTPVPEPGVLALFIGFIAIVSARSLSTNLRKGRKS